MYEIMQISQVHRTVYDFRPLLVKHSHRYANCTDYYCDWSVSRKVQLIVT